MKKIVFSSLFLFVAVLTMAQVQTGQPSVVYYLPKTTLVFEVTYTQTTLQRGIFYQYAERYLGAKDIVLTDHTTAELQQITLHTLSEPDYSQVYSLPLSSQNILPSLTSDGRLRGINLQDDIKQAEQFALPTQKQFAAAHEETILPLLEEQMLANSVQRMAESTARQIYRIRENRLNLLSGDIDNPPADGEALRLMLEQLNAQEKALTALFIGEKNTETVTKYVEYNPEKSIQNHILFRFSDFLGVVDADDLSGAPVQLSLDLQRVAVSKPSDKDKAQPLSAVYYVVPATAQVKLTRGTETLLSATAQVPQMGVTQQLPQSLFTQKQPAHILFDINTGAIQSIQ